MLSTAAQRLVYSINAHTIICMETITFLKCRLTVLLLDILYYFKILFSD